MAKGRGLWLDSVGDRTGKRRVGRPSKSHCLENLVWLTDGLERSLERAHSRLWGGDSNAADTANQVSIAPREGAIFQPFPFFWGRASNFNPRPARGRFSHFSTPSSINVRFQSAPREGAILAKLPCAVGLLSLSSPKWPKPKGIFRFFCNSICKKGAAAASAQVRPPLENAVRLAFAPLEYQRFCHVKARFGTDVLHLVLIAVPQIVKAQAVPLRVDDLF